MNRSVEGTFAGDSHVASKNLPQKMKKTASNAVFTAKLGRKPTPVGKALAIIRVAADCTYEHAMRCYYGERNGSEQTMRIIANVMRAAGPEATHRAEVRQGDGESDR